MQMREFYCVVILLSLFYEEIFVLTYYLAIYEALPQETYFEKWLHPVAEFLQIIVIKNLNSNDFQRCFAFNDPIWSSSQISLL